MNAVSCGGVRGVSDTFASALWALDTLFEFSRVGVDGVNFHTVPNTINELISADDSAALALARSPAVLRDDDVRAGRAAGFAAAAGLGSRPGLAPRVGDPRAAGRSAL